MDGPPRDYAAALNKSPDGWAKALGLKYLRATADEAVAELPVTEQYLKADGTVDEALYSGLVEAVASVGAALHAMRWKLPVVGVENQTSFHQTTRSARLRVTAGRGMHLFLHYDGKGVVASELTAGLIAPTSPSLLLTIGQAALGHLIGSFGASTLLLAHAVGRPLCLPSPRDRPPHPPRPPCCRSRLRTPCPPPGAARPPTNRSPVSLADD